LNFHLKYPKENGKVHTHCYTHTSMAMAGEGSHRAMGSLAAMLGVEVDKRLQTQTGLSSLAAQESHER
jgi:hypothetical protein